MRHAAAAVLFLAGVVHAQEPQALALRSRIDLPGVNGRIDHFTADIQGQRLFMAALGNHTVEVLDVENGKRIHTIPDLAEPQGVLYDTSANRLFVACAKDGTTKLFDAGAFQLLHTVKLSGDVRSSAGMIRTVEGYDQIRPV